MVNHIGVWHQGVWAKRSDLSYPDLLLIIEYNASSALLRRTSSRVQATTGARSWTPMVGPLIVIGSNGSMEPHPSSGADWRRDAVVRLDVCLRRCTVNGQELPPQMLEKVCRSGPEPPRVRRRPKHEGGRARGAVCGWPRAPRAVARNASDAEVRSHSGHDLGRMDEVAGDLLIPTTRSRDCLPFRWGLAR